MREIRETQTPGRSLKGKRDRRAFLAAAAGAAAGATAATLLPQSGGRAEGAAGDPLYLGQGNDAGAARTDLTATVDDGHALMVRNLGAGDVVGLAGSCPSGTGVHGFSDATYGVEGHTRSTFPPGVDAAGVAGFGLDPAGGNGGGPAPGVKGFSGTGPGVIGHSESGPGVYGSSADKAGVEGHSDSSAGVFGGSNTGMGVLGDSETWIGILGRTDSGLAGVVGAAPGEIPGVMAHSQPMGLPMPSDGGVALLVSGRARFSTAGASTIPARSAAVAVANPAVRSDSHITVTFTGDPGGASLAWVERQPDTGFIIHLSGRARWAVPFTYLVVEPGA